MEEIKEIKELGSSSSGSIHCLTIVGQIEGHQVLPEDAKTTKYEHVLPLIAAIEESPEIGGLLALLNTMGGDVEAGLAIAELIAGMKKPSVSLVLGGRPLHRCASGSGCKAQHDSPLGCHDYPSGANKRRGHRCAPDLQLLFTYSGEDSILVTEHSNISREDYVKYMSKTDELANDVGSVIYGREAVDSGLIDQLGTLSDALSYLHGEMEKQKQ